MAITYKVLGQSSPVVTTNTDLYTVPSATSAVCSTLSICNRGISTTYRVAIRPAGELIDNKHYIIYEGALNQYDSAFLTLGISLAATDVVTVYSGTNGLTFNLYGSEIT